MNKTQSNSEKLSPIEEIKKDYLENKDLLGNKTSVAALYKKYHKKYNNLNRRIFLAILNEAHRNIGSPKRYDIYRKQNRVDNKLIYSDFPPSYYNK